MKRKRIPTVSLVVLGKIANRMGVLLIIGVFIGLLYSVILSGYRYQFDIDELLHAQLAYLYHRGYRPYLDIYTFVYPPVFQWITMPAFLLKGFTFDGIYAARVVMIALFILRLGASFLFIQTVFNRRTALFFIPLLLFDPLAVFTSMQYRSDNLMLTLLMLGLLFLSRRSYLLAGFFLGFSATVLTKALPPIAIVTLVSTIYLLCRRRIHRAVRLFVGLSIVPLLLSLYLVSQGSFGEMVQQMFGDLSGNYSHFAYPIPIYSLLKPDNIFIFGTMGKPLTWIYALLIAPLGVAGAYHASYRLLTAQTRSSGDFVKLALILAIPLQWAPLFIVPVVFAQHYMAIHWLFALFTAYALDDLLTVSRSYRLIHAGIVVLLFGSYAALGLTSIRLNKERSTITGKDGIKAIEARWKQIPPDEAVFPGFLFRPQAYPVAYGSFIVNFPESILRRLPDIPTLLSAKKPRLLLDDYTLFRLPNDAQVFINAHYERVPGDTELMVWKK